MFFLFLLFLTESIQNPARPKAFNLCLDH